MRLSSVLSTILLSLIGFGASAAQVTGANINGDQLIVNLRHGGGCGDHFYDLELRGCAESWPVQCQAILKHRTEDYCEALLYREAVFSLRTLGLTDGYYANGSLTITGEGGGSATVRLPAGGPSRPEPSAEGNVECVTHTGSWMVIANNTKTLSLETVAGEKTQYRIVGKELIILESIPSIEKTTYNLDDGRSVVTSFVDGQRTGTGYFIRLNGEASPEFKSCRR